MLSRQMILWSVLALSLPLAAVAQQALTTRWVHVRAGPAPEYPLVTQLPPNAPVAVQGCISDFSWCDVITPDNNRGWVYGGNLVYPYQNGSVPIVQYGAVIGLPIVTFFVGSYWGSYYRGRPWYGDWHRWDRWNHDHFRPGRPGYRPPPPPHRPDFRPPRPPDVRPPPRPRPLGPPVMRPQVEPSRPPVTRPAPQPRPQPNRPPPRPVMRGEGERQMR